MHPASKEVDFFCMDCYSKIVRNSSEKGQVVLMVILIMVVAMTVGLSVAVRSVTNVRISSEEENSQRALAAAEAGIEQVLKTNTPIANQNLGNNSTIKQVQIFQVQSTDFLLNAANLVEKDNGMDLWLVPHVGTAPDFSVPWNGNLSVNWGLTPGDCNNAAMEIIVISGSTAAPAYNRYVFDPCGTRRASNKFSPPSSTGLIIEGKAFAYQAIVPISNGLIARIVPLYVSAITGVSGGAQTFPEQGKRIESIGTSGETQHKVIFFQGYPILPIEFFSYGLFSPK